LILECEKQPLPLQYAAAGRSKVIGSDDDGVNKPHQSFPNRCHCFMECRWARDEMGKRDCYSVLLGRHWKKIRPLH